MRFSCEFVNMSVKQPMLRQRSLYDASAMKFQLFCRLPNPPLTAPMKPPHTLSVQRCPFLPFFCRVPNRRKPTCSKNNFTTVKRVHVKLHEFVCETSDRETIELGGAGEGAKRQCYVAVSHYSCGSLTL